LDWLYGRNSVTEALRAGRRRIQRIHIARGSDPPPSLTDAARLRSVRLEVMDRHGMDQRASNHQGVLAEADPFRYSNVSELLDQPTPLLLVLDSLQDPQNFGTLLRTAQACGISGVLIPEHRAVGVTPAVSNASAGAVEHIRVARVTNLARALEQLKQRNVWTYGLAVGAAASFATIDWTGAAALVVGSEGAGLGRLVRETCDVVIGIPMADSAVQSLNASVAGSIVLYEAFRQRS
jgi:23S rRNA (guanosine2251-2'-O)-methyltransferase